MTNLDYRILDRELDRVKTKVFLGNYSAFLGPLMCSLNFSWTEDIKTAETNGIRINWNPHWFLRLPFDTRVTVLLHELWHVAMLHMLRYGTRDPKYWNYACDIVINNMLCKQGYTFDGTHPWIDDSLNRWKHPEWRPTGDYGDKPSEEVYELLIKNENLDISSDFVWGYDDDGQGDTVDIPGPEQDINEHSVINNVVAAKSAANLSGGNGSGTIPGDVEVILKRFLQPKLPWNLILQKFFHEMTGQDYSWARPNRRYQDMYIPSLQKEEGGLEVLSYYIDVSGSVSDAEIIRCNSEIKFIKDTYNPQKLIVVLFDTKIQKEYVYLEDELFEELIVVGRGGTSLDPVRDHMLKTRPTAAVIFSDLECPMMAPLPDGVHIETIWIAVNSHPNKKVNFGKLIHIKE